MKSSPARRAAARAFHREAKESSSVTFWDWVHGVIYSRWPYFYIGVATGEHPLARMFIPIYSFLSRWLFHPSKQKGKIQAQRFADGYHGKVVTTTGARQLVTLNENLDLGDLEQIIPYNRARDLILKNPDHIAVLDCPCRVVRKNPCLPLDVCLIIGEPFASYVVEHHPGRARYITSEEAETILEEEHARGHVHHAFFKDAMLGRFYAICNCCSCCCGAMQARQNGVPMLASSGYVIRHKEDICTACGDCAVACPFGALKIRDGKLSVLESVCMGCGVCVSVCSNSAMSLERAPHRGEPLEVAELIK